MNIEVSLPDDLLRAADVLADRLGMSRSELVAASLAEWLAKHDQHEVTARLNRVYATEESGLDPLLKRAQRESIGVEDFLEVSRFLDSHELDSIRRRSELAAEDAARLADEIDANVWDRYRSRVEG